VAVTLEDPAVAELVQLVRAAGGAPIGAYHEPLGGRVLLMASLPFAAVQPTPFQRDLSPTHAKRLAQAIEQTAAFLDPLIVVRGEDGKLWTPNGRHRLAAAKVLGLKQITALICADESLAYQILALNTEKAHNLKEKSLEVIRMYRGLLEEEGRKHEDSFAFQFEEAYYATLGLLYEEHPRFAGGAFGSILRRVDKFIKEPLKDAFEERRRRAALVEKASGILDRQVEKVKRRGIRHPFVKNFVLARCNPLTRARKTMPSFDTALKRLIENLESFDAAAVRYDEVARAGVMVAAAATSSS